MPGRTSSSFRASRTSGTTLSQNPHLYWVNFQTTLREIAVGGGGGIAAAFLLAVLMVELPIFESALMPLMIVLMVTPIVAIAPALVIAFGFGTTPKYMVTAIIVFYPMLVNSLAGLRDVDDAVLASSRPCTQIAGRSSDGSGCRAACRSCSPGCASPSRSRSSARPSPSSPPQVSRPAWAH